MLSRRHITHESFSGAKMQWHSGGRVDIVATLVRVDEQTITSLKTNEQVKIPRKWTGTWKVPSGIYLLALPDKPQESNYCLFSPARIFQVRFP